MNRHFAATLLAPTAAALVLLVAAAPASARQDAGDSPLHSSASTSANANPNTGLTATDTNSHDTTNCPLERVGAQLVRCDNLTGNGVSAAASVPLRSAVAAAVTAAATADQTDSWTRFIRHGI